MKRAIIFHGTSQTPGSFWYPWLAEQLQKRGYDAKVPYYPDINRTPITEFLPKVMQNEQIDSETLLIGHSSGAPLVLSILEHVDTVIPLAILVAGYSAPLPDSEDVVLQDKYDWAKIRKNVKDVILINSANDPWGCDDKQGRTMFNHLGGTQIIRNDGHFGSRTYNQPYRSFNLLDKLIP